MSRKYFGTDGIRGRANGVITAELALKVGQAVGLTFQNGEHRHRVLIGKDTRLSGYMIENALTAGFTSVGMDVLLTGPIPTPGVAMLTRSMRADLGVMISASHNPFDDNGIKLFGPDGYKLSDDFEKQIEELIDSDLGRRLATSHEDRPRQTHRRRAGPLHRVRQAHAAARARIRRDARGDRLRQRRRLQGRARGAVGARRGGLFARRRAGRLQHQQGVRLDRARRARPQGARDARRHRHRARRRRRPRRDRGREGPSGRRRPAARRGGGELDGRPSAGEADRGRDRDVQSRVSSATSRASASRWRARRSATATSSSTCARAATISAASRPATSSCRTTRPPGTASWRPCRCWRWSRSTAGRCRKCATATTRCRRC